MHLKQAEETTQLTVRREIRASRRRVFDAWTRPEHLKYWWHSDPKGSTELAEVDLRVGGKYRLGMRDPKAEQVFICFGEFLEVVEPQRLVYTWEWEPPAAEVGETLVTVDFLDLGASTLVVLTHERFSDPQLRAEHAEGWEACIGSLVAGLEKGPLAAD